ncbi:uncharacterized protein LOC112349170 [Selaginella moellendorffii]|uniref:uncharacterized protein LOC112349170 n=1 Tax=Selaginella moellendorffii TaxID=88036 RepID=UPI000D1CE902|nr:uncharacterized protein LOC112349170 [Selaginella moellendorffii]|eukprot:XP_024538827.1 uncharacterized protein LOC112349170 [Selaginella moellendorffii]
MHSREGMALLGHPPGLAFCKQQSLCPGACDSEAIAAAATREAIGISSSQPDCEALLADWKTRIELELFRALNSAQCVSSRAKKTGWRFSGSGSKQPGSRKKWVKSVLGALGIVLAFSGVASVVKILLSALPPDFIDRWRKLEGEQPRADPKFGQGEEPETVIYDCHGEVIATLVPGGYIGKRDPLKTSASTGPLRPSDIPSAMWQAVVASEDRRFFEHHGIDPRGISRAVLTLSSSGGGSTITQQLVKNLFLTNERKWSRKAVEIILALLLEKRMSKWDILRLYLDKIYWGHGVYGLKAAAAFYFGKHPSLLTLAECAMLAGIIPAPELLSPYRDPSRGKKPQARTLRRMVEVGFLDADSAAAAVNEPLSLSLEYQEGTCGPWRAPYFVSEVLYELTQTYGRDHILRGGLQIHTTLDLSIQDIAEKTITEALSEFDNERLVLADKEIGKIREKIKKLGKTRAEEILKAVNAVTLRIQKDAKKRRRKMDVSKLREETDKAISLAAEKAKAAVCLRFDWMEKRLEASLAKYEDESKKAAVAKMEGAVIGIDPLSGAVRVLVGGRDYYESSFNRCTQAFRSPGSTFKPVVYLTALAEGIDPSRTIVDAPYTIGGFTPENYDRKYRGRVTVEESLLRSLNIPTVKLCAEVGVDKVCAMGAALGIDTFLPYELSLSLGGCEVTPLQLATVYATIASGGIYRKPYMISCVRDSQGEVLQEQPAPSEEAVVDEYAVSELRRLLQAVVEKGTGQSARIGRPCAGKTGTSDGYRDAWFAGFTPELSCVVWIGYDDNTPVGGMHPITGYSHAAPLWKHFMILAHEGLPIQRFHDYGRDRYGNQGSRDFEKRSRRPQRLLAFRDTPPTSVADSKFGISGTQWKQVWDWEKASVAWEEREKMQTWTETRSKHEERICALREQWQNLILRPVSGVLQFLKRFDLLH